MTKLLKSLRDSVERVLKEKDQDAEWVSRNAKKDLSPLISKLRSNKLENMTLKNVEALGLGLQMDPATLFLSKDEIDLLLAFRAIDGLDERASAIQALVNIVTLQQAKARLSRERAD